MNIGKKIRIQRIEKDLSQKELANLLGVSYYIVSNLELNKTEPDIETIRKLCVIFDISADEFLEIETESQRNQVNVNRSFNSYNVSGNNNKITF